MHLSLILPAFVLGAFGRRAAGGVLNPLTGHTDAHPLTGDLPTRMGFGATVALAAAMGGASWWQCLLMVPAVWVGTTTGNFGSIDMARNQDTFAHDWLGMSLHAFLSAVLPSVVVVAPLIGPAWPHVWQPFLADPRWLWAFGFTMTAAPIYWFGWAVAGYGGVRWLPRGLRGSVEIAEALWGGMCAAGVFLAFAL